VLDQTMLGQVAFNIVSYAAILIMLSIGLQLVAGLLGVINVAHGELVLIGAYGAFALTLAGGNIWFGLIAVPLAGGLVALAMDRGLLRYLYSRPVESLIMTWALSIFIRQGIQFIFGAYPHSVPDPIAGTFSVFGLLLPRWRLLIIAIGVVTLLGVQGLLHRTSLGLQLRAAVANRDLALSMGINVDRLYSLTFVGAAMLAGLAGFLLAPITSITPQLGIGYLLPAFFVVVLAGFGSILGLIIGAGIIGGLQTVLSLAIDPVMGQILVLIFAFFFIQKRSRDAVTAAV
jgi:branched-chain amino acid transport system permease protein/urea transport system permease protein